MSLAQFFTTYASQIAWIVAAIGWGVAGRQANLREERKELRSEVDEACEVISGILERLREYRTTNPNSREARQVEIFVKHGFEDLNFRLERLKLRCRWWGDPRLDLTEAEAQFLRFYDLATGVDFESSERATEHEEAQLLARQAKYGLTLTDHIQQAFLVAFYKVPTKH